MIRPTKKAKKLIDRLKAKSKHRSGPVPFIELLPKDLLTELEQIKAAMKAGEIIASASAVAKEIIEEHGENAIGVKHKTLSIWLSE